MNTLIITEAMLIIKGETTVQLRISAVLLRKAGRWDVPYAQYNQIMDIEEATVKNFIKENSQRIKELRLYDWPVLYETIEELERILYESQYKYIKIYSSYGLEGWVLAKKVEIVDGNQ